MNLSRKKLYLFFLFCQSIPFFFLSGLNASDEVVKILSISSFLTCVILFFLLRAWEKKMRSAVDFLVREKVKESGSASNERHVAEKGALNAQVEELKRNHEHEINLLHSAVEKNKSRVEELLFELDKKKQDLHVAHLEGEDLKREHERLREEHGALQNSAHDELRRKEQLLSDYQLTIGEQRALLEKKQRYVEKLEAKVRDLTYEIRSLLHLEEREEERVHAPIEVAEYETNMASQNSYDLSLLLNKYLKMTENFMSSDGLGKGNRFLELSSETLALDLRQLLDRFKDETKGIIFIYSLKEERFLFVNPHAKTLLGWSSDKFIREFPQLVGRGYGEWRQALSRLLALKETKSHLTLRNKRGEEVLAQCLMAAVESGPFANHAIGLISTTS